MLKKCLLFIWKFDYYNFLDLRTRRYDTRARRQEKRKEREKWRGGRGEGRQGREGERGKERGGKGRGERRGEGEKKGQRDGKGKSEISNLFTNFIYTLQLLINFLRRHQVHLLDSTCEIRLTTKRTLIACLGTFHAQSYMSTWQLCIYVFLTTYCTLFKTISTHLSNDESECLKIYLQNRALVGRKWWSNIVSLFSTLTTLDSWAEVYF